MPRHFTPDAATIERVAETLYRQHRARNGHAFTYGEWDRAGSLQTQYRDDAQQVLAATRIADHINTAVTETLTGVATQIERELICCDVFDRLHTIEPSQWTPAHEAEHRAHAICYWGAASRALVQDALPTPAHHQLRP